MPRLELRNVGRTALVLFGTAIAFAGATLGSGEPATLTSWTVPTPGSTPGGIVVADGSVYFAEAHGNKLARLDPATNLFTEWDVGLGPERLVIGPEGGIYFTERWADQIGRILPGGDFYTSESVGTAGSEPLGLVIDPSGSPSLWYTERGASKVGRVTLGGLLFDVLQGRIPAVQPVIPATAALPPTTTTLTPYVTPGNPFLPPGIAVAPRTTSGPFAEWSFPSDSMHPRDLTFAPSGSIFVSTETRSILELSPSSNTVLFHDLPITSSSSRLAIDSSGRVWFTESWNGKVGRLNPTTGEVAEWAMPGSQPLAIAVAADDTVWYTDRVRSRIAHLDPAAGVLTEYPLSPGSNPVDIVLGSLDQIWFTTEANWVGRLRIEPTLALPHFADAIFGIHVTAVSTTGARVTVNYLYSGSHGLPVFAGGLPVVGGIQSTAFGYVPTVIATAGSGNISFDISYLGTGCTTTDGIEVYLYDAGRATFLVYQVSMQMRWGSCSP